MEKASFIRINNVLCTMPYYSLHISIDYMISSIIHIHILRHQIWIWGKNYLINFEFHSNEVMDTASLNIKPLVTISTLIFIFKITILHTFVLVMTLYIWVLTVKQI